MPNGGSMIMTDTRFIKVILFVNGIVPLTLLAIDGSSGRLGVNPVEFVLRTTGVLTLIFVLITLAVTPLRTITGRNELIKLRRMLGLFAFFYGCLHLTTYLGFDRGLDIPGTVGDVIQRPFIAIGMASFLLMVPLAVTSTNGMVKRIGGKNWRRLHRLTYVVGIGGVVHFWMIVKSDVFYPAVFAAALAFLLGYRVFFSRRKTVAVRRV